MNINIECKNQNKHIPHKYSHQLIYQPKSQRDYINLNISIINDRQILDNCYQFIEIIGYGSTSKVWKAFDIINKEYVAIKIIELKKDHHPDQKTTNTNRIDEIKKEIMILNVLQSSIHIINFKTAFIFDSNIYMVQEFCPTTLLSLIVDLKLNDQSKTKIKTKIELEIMRSYMFQLLSAIDLCHSKGIIHCDIKPSNIVITNPKNNLNLLKLIDFGHSCFYWPGNIFSPFCGTVAYTAIENLLNYKYFNYAIDMWSIGCVFLFLMYPTESVEKFHANNRNDQIKNIHNKFGSIALNQLAAKYHLTLYELPQKDSLSWCTFLNVLPTNEYTYQFIDLINKLLCLDPEFRINTTDAMNHKFFTTTIISE